MVCDDYREFVSLVRRRGKRARTCTGALTTCLFLAMTSLAHADSAPAPANLESRFLRAETSAWDWFGMKLSKNGQQVGPSLFSVVPDQAVAGSSEGKRHASRARVFQGFVFGFSLIGVGLVIGGLEVRSNDNAWSDTAKLMVAGGLLADVCAYMFSLFRQNEMFAAVDAYNYDLVTGRLGR